MAWTRWKNVREWELIGIDLEADSCPEGLTQTWEMSSILPDYKNKTIEDFACSLIDFRLGRKNLTNGTILTQFWSYDSATGKLKCVLRGNGVDIISWGYRISKAIIFAK